MKKFGFTLPEVLITLAIIGTVAAVTMPTLIVNFNTKQWATAAEVFEKKLNEAMKDMNTAQVISGHPDTLSFVNELEHYFKVYKVCKNDELQECFNKTVWWGAGDNAPEEIDLSEITLASHFGLSDWGTELIGVQFANGVTGLVAYNPKCSGDPLSNLFKGSSCISMLYDVSGSKNPNTLGKDLGNYGIINKIGKSGCAAEVGSACFGTTFEVTPHMWNACGTGSSTDSADNEFMSKYELKYCAFDQAAPEPEYGLNKPDYFAAIAENCGGTSNMPTSSQLTALAEWLYDDNGLNTKKAAALGITTDNFSIFAGTEVTPTASTGITFNSNSYSGPYGHPRFLNRFLGLCIVK